MICKRRKLNFEKLSSKLIDIAEKNNSDKAEMIKLIKEVVPEFEHAENGH